MGNRDAHLDRIACILERLEKDFKHYLRQQDDRKRFTAFVYQENFMAIGTITPGGSGTFAVQLFENGTPYTGDDATSWQWSADVADVTVAPATDSKSAIFTVPASSTDTELTVTASATAPDGTTELNPTLTVTIAASTQPTVFTATITQTA